MNSKTKTKFICHNCGAETPKWMGKCPNCGEWNSLEEKIEESIPKSIRTLSFQSGKEPTSLTDIEIKDTDRVKLGITELDRPLGGGIVSDSVILWVENRKSENQLLFYKYVIHLQRWEKLYYIAVVRNQIYRLK